nr:hypothetical protein [Tanacetum cinerariifolium]
MSLVLPLLVGGIVSFVTSVSRSTTLGGEEVVGIVDPLYAVPLRVVIPFKSSFGLVMVLLRRVPEPEDQAVGIVCLHVVCELNVLILIVSVLILIKPWWSEIIVRTIAKQITVTLRIPCQTIKPSGGMMCQGVRKEIQTKGVIGDPIHFDTLGDMQEFFKMLVSIVTRKSMKLARILNLLDHIVFESKICLIAIRAIGPPRPFKVGWHNTSIVRRSGTGGSPFSSVAISKSFKRVGSTRDLLRMVNSRLSRGGKRFLADKRVLMHQIYKVKLN